MYQNHRHQGINKYHSPPMEQVAWIFNRKCMMNFLHDYAGKHLGTVAAVPRTRSVSFSHVSPSLSVSGLLFNFRKPSPKMRTTDTCQHFRKCVTPHRCSRCANLTALRGALQGRPGNLRAIRKLRDNGCAPTGVTSSLWWQTSGLYLSHPKIFLANLRVVSFAGPGLFQQYKKMCNFVPPICTRNSLTFPFKLVSRFFEIFEVSVIFIRLKGHSTKGILF